MCVRHLQIDRRASETPLPILLHRLPLLVHASGGAWAFASIAVEAGKSYKVALKQGTKSHTLLNGEELEAFAQGNLASTAVHLVVQARKAGAPPAGGGAPTFSELTVTAAELVPERAAAGHELGEALGKGRTGDITPVPAGVYKLRVTCAGEAAPLEASLVVGQPDDVLLESPAQGCNVVRVRAGRPGAWGARWFFVTVAPPSQRILIAPSNNGGGSDLWAANGAADELAAYYKKKLGFAADIMRTKRTASEERGPPHMCASWDALIARLEGAESEPYARVFTIGHGGWDGTMMDGSPMQISPRLEADFFWRFTDAIKKGTTPDARIYFSSCHGGGSNQGEEAEHEKLQADAKKQEADAKAKKAAAEKKRDAAKAQEIGRAHV